MNVIYDPDTDTLSIELAPGEVAECQRRLKFPEKCRAKNPLVGGVGDQPAW